MEFTRNIGDNCLYTSNGDKIGEIHPDYIDTVVDALNEDSDDKISDDEKELLEHLKQHEISNIADFDKLLSFKEKHEANEQHWNEIYEGLTNMLSFDLRDDEVDIINDMIAEIKLLDVKQTDHKWLEKQSKKTEAEINKRVKKALNIALKQHYRSIPGIITELQKLLPSEDEKPKE